MATKKIILDFKDNLTLGTSFVYDIYIGGIKLDYGGSLNTVNLNYGSSSSFPLQILLGSDIDETIANTHYLLSNVYDFNGSFGSFMTSVSFQIVDKTIEVIVTINGNDEFINFFKIYSSNSNLIIRPENPCTYCFISNQSLPSIYSGIYALTTTNYYLKDVTLGNGDLMSIPNAFDVRLIRGHQYQIIQNYNSGLIPPTIHFTFTVYDSINNLNVNASIVNNDLTIDLVGGITLSNYKYSIDGVTYQTSNIFTGLSVGNHTFYVADNLGCIKSFNITNNGTANGNTVLPYVHIPEANSIRIVEQVTHGNCGNYKNVYNTLSCQENTPIKNGYLQLFQSCDTNIRTQLQSSYDNIEAYAIDSDGVETELTAEKIINNIRLEDKRDCSYYTFNGQLAVLFTTGNTYNYGTTTVIGTYTLNGLLPEFGEVGTWVETPYGNLMIVAIRLADDGQRSLLLNANINITGVNNSNIQTIYNRESYNVWELPTDMSDFLNKRFHIIMRFYQTTPDVNFPDKFWLSEKIHVKERHERTKEVKWSNTKNTDIYFFSGIEMINRLQFAEIETLVVDGSTEIEKTDSTVEAIDAMNYFGAELEVLNLSTGMARKIILALRHNNLIIENIPYKLMQEPELTRIGKTNYYNLKAKLLEAGDTWNQGTANTQVIYSQYELIGYLESDTDKFIKI